LQKLEQAARGQENLMPVVLAAAAGYATLGEISGRLKSVFGEYREAA
jgi:methylmalonyl-CoA mutase N-terminal domain/subunit